MKKGYIVCCAVCALLVGATTGVYLFTNGNPFVDVQPDASVVQDAGIDSDTGSAELDAGKDLDAGNLESTGVSDEAFQATCTDL